MAEVLDAVVVGSGPNGLTAAVALARAGKSVLVLEAEATPGGATRTAELTLPGFRHDVCSAVHPLGELSPFLRTLPLADHGLSWAHPPVSVAHPLDDEPAVLLTRGLDETATGLGADRDAWTRLFAPWVAAGPDLFDDLLGPLRVPARPWLLARFGWYGVRPASMLAHGVFRERRARALFAGCAAHSMLPFDRLLTSAVGLVFALSGHQCDWPVARGGSRAIADALVRYLAVLGGRVETGRRVMRMAELPPSRVVLFDLAPRQVAEIAGDALPAGYRRRLGRYRYGPATFKLDWALSGPIPWSDPNCARASTVHVGGTLEEVARSEAEAWRGEASERPFVLVAQQSHFDDTRAPAGKHTGYAYCHVPHASTVDMTERIERQIERFAPGFRDCILARHVRTPAEIERENASAIGGVIAGGAADVTQFFTRPVARLDPYSTPNPALFLCSHATPPGGGVHGMCGYFAARSALRRLGG